MIHLDLFSGIGGFAYAADQVWDDVEHIFCDNEPFVQKILKKHWPESEIYDDIRAITNTGRKHGSEGAAEGSHREKTKRGAPAEVNQRLSSVDLLTGGFPCQPFSQAGARRGTSDDRFLWPEMLRVIQFTKPTWVIAENVRGLLTLEQGVVFEQVCTDLEASGYEVQPFIIPAVAVNAPHRRDRIWFVANAVGGTGKEKVSRVNGKKDGVPTEDRQEGSGSGESVGTTRLGGEGTTDRLQNKRSLPERENDTHANYQRLQGGKKARNPSKSRTETEQRFGEHPESWEQDWLEVAAYASRVDDGLPNRSHRLKSLGNAIVPQVAIEIMKGLK